VRHATIITHRFRFKQGNVDNSGTHLSRACPRRSDPAGSSAANGGLPRFAIAGVADHIGDESCSKTKWAAVISPPNGRELVRVRTPIAVSVQPSIANTAEFEGIFARDGADFNAPAAELRITPA
jgi:hypothetical protein